MPGLLRQCDSPGYFIFRADYARAEIAENSVFSAAAIGLCMTEKAGSAAQKRGNGLRIFAGKFSLLYRNEYMVK